MAIQQILLLNYDYRPIKIINWKKALELWATDKVEIVEEYEDIDIKTVSFTMKLPAVLRLRNYVKYFLTRQLNIKFSRMNVFHRDNFTCMYCGKQPGVRELTMDHVKPKSRNGKTSWENIVTSCKPCNSRKGHNTLRELKWSLNREPEAPKPQEFFTFRLAIPKTPRAWKNYIEWIK